MAPMARIRGRSASLSVARWTFSLRRPRSCSLSTTSSGSIRPRRARWRLPCDGCASSRSSCCSPVASAKERSRLSSSGRSRATALSGCLSAPSVSAPHTASSGHGSAGRSRGRCSCACTRSRVETRSTRSRVSQTSGQHPNQVLDWSQIFVETLIATNTPNSSSQRLGAIVHTAIFDAYNGIERRYTPIFVQNLDDHGESLVPKGASRRAAVVAAAYTALVALFPSREQQLSDSYAASLAALSDDGGDGGRSRDRGIAWGEQAARAVLAWRAADGFLASYPPFTGGTAVGQWRPIPPATSMSAQGLAFTAPFVVESDTQFRPDPPRTLGSATYTQDFNAVKALGRRTGSMRTEAQTALAPFWEGNASVHWNQAANQIARAKHLSMSRSNRLLAVLNLAMADTSFTIWSAKRHYGADPAEVTWRPLTAITLADTDGIAGTAPDPAWLPLVATPS